MVFNYLLVCLLLIFGSIGIIVFVAETIIEKIKDIKGDAVGEKIKILKEKGYEVEVENGTIFILLPEKEYYSRSFRKNIDQVMSGYSKSYGIRLKESEECAN